MRYNNLVILGTSHIAKQSLDEVESYVERENPAIIAIELDRKRLPSLLSKEKKSISPKAIKYIGVKGYLFSLLGAWAERKLGNLVGVAPGSEMKKAVEIAREKGIELALVDQDIEITLKRFSKELTWREKRHFIADILKALMGKKKDISFDLRKVPEKKIIKKLTEQVRKRYPNIYKVLITERNEVIAKNLKRLVEQNPEKKILAILGAGHVDDVLELVKDSEDGDITYSFSADNFE